MVKQPIWKDTLHTFSTNDCRYQIVVDEETIYEGRAKARPGEDYASIYVNRICRNYLDESLNLDVALNEHTNAYREFTVYSYNKQTDIWLLEETYGFLMSWDNEVNLDLEEFIDLSVPVNGRLASNQICTYTVFDGDGTNAVETNVGKTPYWGYESGYCGDYALIYRNRLGGYDSFLFEGKCKPTDTYITGQITKEYNNTTKAFGKTTYQNYIVKTWELNSGFLTNEQSDIFAKHLVSSTECFLQDLNLDIVYPVVITDKSVEYKHFPNEGNEPINYTITVEQSQKTTIL